MSRETLREAADALRICGNRGSAERLYDLAARLDALASAPDAPPAEPDVGALERAAEAVYLERFRRNRAKPAYQWRDPRWIGNWDECHALLDARAALAAVGPIAADAAELAQTRALAEVGRAWLKNASDGAAKQPSDEAVERGLWEPKKPFGWRLTPAGRAALGLPPASEVTT